MTGLPPTRSPGRAAAERAESTWGSAYRTFWEYRRSILLPAAVVLGPAALLLSGGLAFLLIRIWPNADLSVGGAQPEDIPQGFIFGSLLIMGVAGFLFTVALASVTVAARSATIGKPLPLALALDPAFTRMGGVLVLFLIFATLGTLSAVGGFFLIYLIVRFGLAFQVFMLEEVGAWSALGRCWLLIRGRMLRFFSLLLSMVGIGTVAVFLIQGTIATVIGLLLTPFSIDSLETGLGATDSVSTAEALVMSAAAGFSLIGLIPLMAFFTTLTTVFYLRAREETPA